MKPFATGLIVCFVAILFVLWNRRYIFGVSGSSSSSSASSKKGGSVVTSRSMKNKNVVVGSVTEEEDETTMLLSGLLSLNRAAHVLSRSTDLLDKLLKMDKQLACDSLLRDYDLSSLMVLIKHEDEAEHNEPDGFKKISEVKKEKEKEKEKTVETKSDDHHHHSTSDPLRIALYCKNLMRPPKIGRVVRMVQSEPDRDREDKYIIELIK